MTSKLMSVDDALPFGLWFCFILESVSSEYSKIRTSFCILVNANCCDAERWESCSCDTTAALSVGNDFSWSSSNSWNNLGKTEKLYHVMIYWALSTQITCNRTNRKMSCYEKLSKWINVHINPHFLLRRKPHVITVSQY